MSYSLLSILPWLFTSIIVGVGGLNIASALILLKERHSSAWLMLAGAIISVMGNIGAMIAQVFMMNSVTFKVEFLIAISSFTYLGGLLFAIGLLLHALHQRSKSNRIQELEAILASLQKP